jgi:hypothetical protein
VARDITDFEGEVSVEFRGEFPSRLHLAAVSKKGAVLFGEAGEPAALTFRSIATEAREVHWAGHQLAILGQGGNLRVGALVKDGQMKEFQNFGHAEEFRLTPERVLLVNRTPHEVSMIQPRLVPVPQPVDQPAPTLTLKENPPARTLRIDGFDLGSERYLIEGKNGERTFAAFFEVSSIRPGFQRRPVALPQGPAEKTSPIAFH